MIFGAWRPLPVVLGTLPFGGVTFGFMAQARGWGIPSAFLAMLPHLCTLVLMILPILLRPTAQKWLGASPAALGLLYTREAS